MRHFVRLFLIATITLLALNATAAERTTYLVPDAQGSPVAALDEQGNVLWRETYRPYGERHTKSAANDAKTAYTGKPEDTDTGLVYMGARWYDPETARFTGIDPQGFSEGNPQSFGRYGYANNSPYRYVDPDGESAVEGVVFVTLDVVQVGTALYTGVGLGAALGDLALDVAGAAIPVPGAGAAMKAGFKTSKLSQGIRETRAAKNAPVGVTEAGERFVRVGAEPQNLKATFDGKTGTMAGTYAFPEKSFKAMGADPSRLKNLGDLPGSPPQYVRTLTPPAGTPIQRGVVPGGEYGGAGGASEVIFPKGY